MRRAAYAALCLRYPMGAAVRTTNPTVQEQYIAMKGVIAHKQYGHGLFAERRAPIRRYDALWRHIRIQFYPAAEEMPHNIF